MPLTPSVSLYLFVEEMHDDSRQIAPGPLHTGPRDVVHELTHPQGALADPK